MCLIDRGCALNRGRGVIKATPKQYMYDWTPNAKCEAAIESRHDAYSNLLPETVSIT